MQMKKKVLSAAILVAMGMGSAQAVNLSTDGVGQVLIFPYFTTQGSEETLISIVNTKDEFKAIKVRFRESMNSAEVLDFNLYLSPFDVWTAKIHDSSTTDGAAITTHDTSCTIPQFSGTAVNFRSSAYTGLQSDGGPTDIERTKEGYVEIIEMGIADRANLDPQLSGWVNALGQNMALHVNGTPIDCAGLVGSMVAGTWSNGTELGMLPPTGGLSGSAGIINVALGNEVSTPVTALKNFRAVQVHNEPASESPHLGQALPLTSNVIFDGVAITDNWVAPLEMHAVNALLMANAITNEYNVNPVIQGETDWVVTFPTKRYHVNFDDPTLVVEPFTADFPYNAGLQRPLATSAGVSDGVACESINVRIYDREEAQTGSVLDFSPIEIVGNSLCWDANVINFGESNVLSAEYSDVHLPVPDTFISGWARITFNDARHQITNLGSGNVYHGLPAIGFRTTRIANDNVVGGNYEMSTKHNIEAMITSGP